MVATAANGLVVSAADAITVHNVVVVVTAAEMETGAAAVRAEAVTAEDAVVSKLALFFPYFLFVKLRFSPSAHFAFLAKMIGRD
jgi:hypothetical protein